MLTKESFIKGIKDMRAVFGINPDKETLEIWFRHLSKLDDKYFLAGVSLLADNEEAFYPNTNIVYKIKEYAQRAREKELAMQEQIKADWEVERYKLLEQQHEQKVKEANQRLIDRRPDLEEIFKRVFGGKKGVKLLNVK